MKLEEFDFDLPKELIAQQPCEKRQLSRLLVLNKANGNVSHDRFENIIDYIGNGDCLILNDTRVLPARILGKRVDTSGMMEFVLLKDHGDDVWEVLVRPGKRAIPGREFKFGENRELTAKVIKIVDDGIRLVKFNYKGIFFEILEKVGVIPLPPYITKELLDKERYQTVYSKYTGSAAAPTAGLHFTKELLKKILQKGVDIAYVTLHIGLGTFRPVKVKNISDHKMHAETFSISQDSCDKINRARTSGKRVIAVGTTSCRVVETVSDQNGFLHPFEGETDIFIYPGYNFKVVDELITNFHLPRSTLLMLVSALASKKMIMDAYDIAIENRYRFFSFGDAMIICNREKRNND